MIVYLTCNVYIVYLTYKFYVCGKMQKYHSTSREKRKLTGKNTQHERVPNVHSEHITVQLYIVNLFLFSCTSVSMVGFTAFCLVGGRCVCVPVTAAPPACRPLWWLLSASTATFSPRSSASPSTPSTSRRTQRLAPASSLCPPLTVTSRSVKLSWCCVVLWLFCRFVLCRVVSSML